jgi:hypothetical protein
MLDRGLAFEILQLDAQLRVSAVASSLKPRM